VAAAETTTTTTLVEGLVYYARIAKCINLRTDACKLCKLKKKARKQKNEMKKNYGNPDAANEKSASAQQQTTAAAATKTTAVMVTATCKLRLTCTARKSKTRKDINLRRSRIKYSNQQVYTPGYKYVFFFFKLFYIAANQTMTTKDSKICNTNMYYLITPVRGVS